MNIVPLSLEATPIVAILRGVRPGEVVGVATALIKSGIRAIEVPLNSPEPLASIERISSACADACLCGAGTVLEPRQVDDVKAAGGSLVVSPNVDVRVIRRALEVGLTVMPGFATATEAFAAVEAGAQHLKLFPASTYGTGHLGALRAVLPKTVRVYAVGGVGAQNLAAWLQAGADGVGIGTELYRPGDTPNDVALRADTLVATWRSCRRAA